MHWQPSRYGPATLRRNPPLHSRYHSARARPRPYTRNSDDDEKLPGAPTTVARQTGLQAAHTLRLLLCAPRVQAQSRVATTRPRACTFFSHRRRASEHSAPEAGLALPWMRACALGRAVSGPADLPRARIRRLRPPALPCPALRGASRGRRLSTAMMRVAVLKTPEHGGLPAGVHACVRACLDPAARARLGPASSFSSAARGIQKTLRPRL